jgi:hypothetical protein
MVVFPIEGSASTDFESWAKESFEIATTFAYRSGGPIWESERGEYGLPMVAGVPVLPTLYVVSASRIADRRIMFAGYRLADLLRGSQKTREQVHLPGSRSAPSVRQA